MSGEKKERSIQKITLIFFIEARPSSLSKNGSAKSDVHAYFRYLTVLYWVVSDPANMGYTLDEEKNRYAAETKYWVRYSEGLDSCQESLIWHQREVTWEQGPISLVSITLQRNLIASINCACAEHQFWAIS